MGRAAEKDLVVPRSLSRLVLVDLAPFFTVTGFADDSASQADGLVPIQVQGLTTDVTAIAAGVAHTCAVVGGAVELPFWSLERGPALVEALAGGLGAAAVGEGE